MKAVFMGLFLNYKTNTHYRYRGHDMKVTINKIEREITGLKKVKYARTSAINGDEVGLVEYAEYTIVGANKKWTDWTQLDKFMEDNPGVI